MSSDAAPSGAEDARLVRRAREGDREAFETLVRRHLAAAHRVALSRTGNRYDADDVCQDAFLRALTKIEQCRHPERFRSWLLTIVKNTALNALKRESRRRKEPLDAAHGHSDGVGPDEDLERRTLGKDLQRAVDELPEMQRKVLTMHDYEGWTHAEIGEELGIASGTSRYHLHAARTSMRDSLEEYDETMDSRGERSE